MSVHLAEVARQHDLEPVDLLPGPTDEFGMVTLEARHVRAHRQIIIREPEPTDPTHAEVIGIKTTKVRKRLRDGAAVLRVPPSADAVGP